MAHGEGTLRLFIAVELPEQVQRDLDETMAAIGRAGAPDILRWVRPESVHLTLKFLGATPPSKVREIEAGLHRALVGASPFELRPDRVGSFGGRRNLRVVWLGVSGATDRLAGLAARVEREIAPLGFPTEQRAFRAHLTLARVRDEASPADRERLHSLLATLRAPECEPFTVDSVSLMRSTLSRSGAVYNAISSFRLEP